MDASQTDDFAVLADLEQVLRARRAHAPAGSYSATLVNDPEQAARKIMEEAFEVCLELGRARVEPDRVASESADLVFHLMAGLVGAGVPLHEVTEELRRRRTSDAASEHS